MVCNIMYSLQQTSNRSPPTESLRVHSNISHSLLEAIGDWFSDMTNSSQGAHHNNRKDQPYRILPYTTERKHLASPHNVPLFEALVREKNQKKRLMQFKEDPDLMGTVSGWKDRFIMPLDSDTMDPLFDLVSLLLVCERKKNNVDVRDKFFVLGTV